MSETSKKLPRATIAQAKAAWEAQPKPSVRTVAAALRASGLSCAIATLQRWHKADWVLKNDVKVKETTAEQAAIKAADGVKQLEEKALNRLEAIMLQEATVIKRIEELGQVKITSELAEQAMRASLIAQIVLAEQIVRRAVVLVEIAPGKVADIIHRLKGPAASTTIVIPPDQAPHFGGNGDGARVVDGRVLPDKSPSALAIESFKVRRREKEGVAA